MRPHFVHDLASVGRHGDLADAELVTDLFVQQASDHQRHNLIFAGGK